MWHLLENQLSSTLCLCEFCQMCKTWYVNRMTTRKTNTNICLERNVRTWNGLFWRDGRTLLQNQKQLQGQPRKYLFRNCKLCLHSDDYINHVHDMHKSSIGLKGHLQGNGTKYVKKKYNTKNLFPFVSKTQGFAHDFNMFLRTLFS